MSVRVKRQKIERCDVLIRHGASADTPCPWMLENSYLALVKVVQLGRRFKNTKGRCESDPDRAG